MSTIASIIDTEATCKRRWTDKSGIQRFFASHFSKAILRRNRQRWFAVATAAVTIATLAFFFFFSFFFYLFRSFPSSHCPLTSWVSFGKPREKRSRRIYVQLCTPFCSPRPSGDFDERSVGFVRLLANYGWKISTGEVSVIVKERWGHLISRWFNAFNGIDTLKPGVALWNSLGHCCKVSFTVKVTVIFLTRQRASQY